MKAILINQPGPDSRLQIADLPRPQPMPGEALIKIHYTALNRADLMQRAGSYPPPPGASPILGLEASGEIVEINAIHEQPASGFHVGDKVCALIEGGGYAEYCTAPLGQILPIPAGLDFKQAACLPEACFTVWLSLVERGSFKAGESVLIHGGASGIGVIAIQMMKHLGASSVFATAGNPEKLALCRTLGAIPISYHDEDFTAVIKEQTKSRGVDCILDIAGGDYLDKNLRAMAENGRCVIISLLKGGKAEASLAPLLFKRLTVAGSTLRSRSAEEKLQIRDKLQKFIWPAIAAGKIRPILDSSFPLNEAEKAHSHMQQNLNLGKIVLEV